ncbi:MAG: AraC family transcriptional regulator [Lachnospiraceae bacterium]|nr:AraC family transcriptional regulator [Lachnospiraceae bacterium]
MNQADVEKALDYINRRLTECITLEEIAKYCGYSAFHFSREFTKQTGMGVFDTMIKMRMNRAKSMLTSSSKSVLEIALESGYETHNGFTTAFIKWIGCNPTVYRVHENKSKQYERQEPNLKAKNLSNSLMSTQRLTREGHTRGVQMGASMENTVIRFWRM